MKKRRVYPERNRRAFTLVELLVVVAIIGILATVVVISYSGATIKAKNSAIISDVNQANTAIQEFGINNNGYAGLTCNYNAGPSTCDTLAGNSDSDKNTIGLASKDILSKQGINSTGNGAGLFVTSNSSSYNVLALPLPVATNIAFCADFQGRVGQVTATRDFTNTTTGGVYSCSN